MSDSIANTLKIVWRFRFPVAIRIKKIKPAALKLPKKQKALLSMISKGTKKKAKLGRRNYRRANRRRSWG
jgi:hypothetical protein